MGSDAPSCACRHVDRVESVGSLLIYSSAPHTLEVVSRVGADLDVDVAGRGTWRELTGESPTVLVAALADTLTAVEKHEVRAAIVPHCVAPDDRMALAFGALTLDRLAARIEYEHLVGLVDDLDRFYALYQPIVSLDSGEAVGYESLLRATNEDGTEIGAADLFRAAIAGGWTNSLDRVGREVAIRDAAGWIGDASLFINFIPTSVYRPEVCMATTFAAASTYGLDVRQIVFEMVETDRTDDISHLLDVVDHYRARGSRVAVDDVGSGYSSLEVVAQVRPEIIKVEQRLIRQLPDPTATAIVGAVAKIASDLGARLVAEGVETAEHVERAAALGCDLAQGWYFGKPARAPSAG